MVWWSPRSGGIAAKRRVDEKLHITKTLCHKTSYHKSFISQRLCITLKAIFGVYAWESCHVLGLAASGGMY